MFKLASKSRQRKCIVLKKSGRAFQAEGPSPTWENARPPCVDSLTRGTSSLFELKRRPSVRPWHDDLVQSNLWTLVLSHFSAFADTHCAVSTRRRVTYPFDTNRARCTSTLMKASFNTSPSAVWSRWSRYTEDQNSGLRCSKLFSSWSVIVEQSAVGTEKDVTDSWTVL